MDIISQEDLVTEHLVKAWNIFSSINQTHPCHLENFYDGIHKCQTIIMWRECQRNNPEKYPIKL